jgi:pentatricopeptide repeat protein
MLSCRFLNKQDQLEDGGAVRSNFMRCFWIERAAANSVQLYQLLNKQPLALLNSFGTYLIVDLYTVWNQGTQTCLDDDVECPCWSILTPISQMYSRSRNCLSKRKAHDLLIRQPRPNAPLDFLYPRWFSQPPAPPETPSAGPAARIGEGFPNTFFPNSEAQQGLRTGHVETQLLEHGGQAEATPTLAGGDIQEVRATLESRRTPARIVREKEFASSKGIVQLRRTGVRESSPSQRELKRMLYKGKAEKDITWTVPAHIMAKAMVLPTHWERERILLRERTIVHLTGTAHENTWIHNARGGCEIHVLPKAPGSTGKREVLMRGSEVARRITRQYLHAEDKVVHEANGENEEHLERNIRWVPSEAGFDPDIYDSLRADQMPVPEEWSVKTFAKQVEDVCAIRLSRGMQRDLYPGAEELHRNVADVLEELFSQPELTPYLSSHAFNLALQYTCKFAELGSTTELLFRRAKQTGLHRQTWIFNIMIERALRAKDMERLTEIVQDMITAGVAPDGMSWAKLLLFSHRQNARRVLLDFIFRIYSEEFPTILAHVAQRLVAIEMVQIVKQPDGFTQFVRRMDSSFGPDWLTTPTLDKMLKTCADNELWQTAEEILELAKTRKIDMLPSTVKALMYMHYQNDNLRAALDLLDSPQVFRLGYDTTSAIHWAFLTAWQRKRYNVCRVLWQYAATRGLISFQMQNRVFSSLIRNQNLGPLPEHQSWADLAGKIVIGTNLDTTGFNTRFPQLNKYFSTTKDPLQWLVQWTPQNGTREEQVSLAKLMMHRDLEAWKVLRPIHRGALPELLRTALRKDEAWVIEKFHKHATLAEMLANAVQVPLTVADGNRSYELSDPPTQWWTENEEKATERSGCWRPFVETNLSAPLPVWRASLSSLFLETWWPAIAFIKALQKCRQAPGLYLPSMWMFLIQRIGFESNPPVLWETTARAQQTT